VVIDVAEAPPTDEQTYRELAPKLIRFATALVRRVRISRGSSSAPSRS
jgi:hypothetical protein